MESEGTRKDQTLTEERKYSERITTGCSQSPINNALAELLVMPIID